jgi:DnaJ-like protein
LVDRAIAYATLGLTSGATQSEIRSAYRRRAFHTHPDRAGGSASAFQDVADAYRTIGDAVEPAAQDPAPAPGPAGARVPPTDAARVLFEYLGDLASEMILNGATPEAVVAFLAGEGCPESVARALDRDLRARVQPDAWDVGAAAACAAAAARAAAAPPPTTEPGPVRPAPGARRASSAAVTVAALAAIAAVAAAAAAFAWRGAESSTSLTVSASERSPASAPAAPQPQLPAAPAPARSAPVRRRTREPQAQSIAPPRSPRPAARDTDPAALRAASADLDAERDAIEVDRNRLAAEAAELEAERRRIDAAETVAAAAIEPEQLAALSRRKAAYNAHLEAARRAERSIQRRVDELNARIVSYNDRIRAARER